MVRTRCRSSISSSSLRRSARVFWPGTAGGVTVGEVGFGAVFGAVGFRCRRRRSQSVVDSTAAMAASRPIKKVRSCGRRRTALSSRDIAPTDRGRGKWRKFAECVESMRRSELHQGALVALTREETFWSATVPPTLVNRSQTDRQDQRSSATVPAPVSQCTTFSNSILTPKKRPNPTHLDSECTKGQLSRSAGCLLRRMALGKVTLDLNELRWPALTTLGCVAVYAWQVLIASSVSTPPAELPL